MYIIQRLFFDQNTPIWIPFLEKKDRDYLETSILLWTMKLQNTPKIIINNNNSLHILNPYHCDKHFTCIISFNFHSNCYCQSRQKDRYEQRGHGGTDTVTMNPDRALEELKAHSILIQRLRWSFYKDTCTDQALFIFGLIISYYIAITIYQHYG